MNALPNFQQVLADKGVTSRAWYTFWANLFRGIPPAPEKVLAPSASPFTYIATQGGFLIVQGGTVSLIQWSRGGITNYTTGVTQGPIPVSAGDSLIVTYSLVPNMTFVPQ